MGEHPQRHAQEGSREGGLAGSTLAAHPLANSPSSAIRTLRENVQALGGCWNPRPAVLHYCLPEYLNPEARIRLHLGISAGERRWFKYARERSLGALSQLRRARQS